MLRNHALRRVRWRCVAGANAKKVGFGKKRVNGGIEEKLSPAQKRNDELMKCWRNVVEKCVGANYLGVSQCLPGPSSR